MGVAYEFNEPDRFLWILTRLMAFPETGKRLSVVCRFVWRGFFEN
jgi:hypothetical protein